MQGDEVAPLTQEDAHDLLAVELGSMDLISALTEARYTSLDQGARDPEAERARGAGAEVHACLREHARELRAFDLEPADEDHADLRYAQALARFSQEVEAIPGPLIDPGGGPRADDAGVVHADRAIPRRSSLDDEANAVVSGGSDHHELDGLITF